MINDKTRMMLNALRSTPEATRTRGIVLSQTGRMCACAVMAKALDISIRPDTTTLEIISRIVAESEVPEYVIQQVPAMNDAIVIGDESGTADCTKYLYSWPAIAEVIETELAGT